MIASQYYLNAQATCRLFLSQGDSTETTAPVSPESPIQKEEEVDEPQAFLSQNSIENNLKVLESPNLE